MVDLITQGDSVPSPNALTRGRPRHLALRLTAAEHASLCALAEQRGVTPARLAETWVYLQLVDAQEVQP